MTIPPLPIASVQDGSYPRPQLMRAGWCDLTGPWQFAMGETDGAPDQVSFDRTILVPFPPESAASGLREEGMLHSVWYRRTFGPAELASAGSADGAQRVLLHFGAVDWEATVWGERRDRGESPRRTVPVHRRRHARPASGCVE